MIRNYSEYVRQRWNELQVTERSANLEPESEEIEAVQSGALVIIAGELAHTTKFEARKHPDVGLYFKNGGNFYHDSGSGLDISTDILAIRDTNPDGSVADSNVVAIVDVITKVKARDASPGWIVQGLAGGNDSQKWREPPQPPNVDPVDPGGEEPGNGEEQKPVQTVDLSEILNLLLISNDEQRQTRAAIENMNATLQGIRRDVANGSKILGQLVAGGGLGDIIGGLIPRRQNPDFMQLSEHGAKAPDVLKTLPEGFVEARDQDRSA